MDNFYLLYFQFKLDPLKPMPRFDMPGPAGFIGNMRLDINHQPPFCIVTIAGRLEECGTMQDVCKYLDVFIGDNEVMFGKVVYLDPKTGRPLVIRQSRNLPANQKGQAQKQQTKQPQTVH